MERRLIELLACPDCHGILDLQEEAVPGSIVWQGVLLCTTCNLHYPVEQGIPRMMPSERATAVKQWEKWPEKQSRSLEESISPDPEAKSYFDDVATQFGSFCDMRGTILDVGCGAAHPAYAIMPEGSTHIGLDPEIGNVIRKFDFVQGIAEALPFRSGVFDWTLIATSLDHFPEPIRALAEVKRVLKPTGRLGLWVGVIDPEYFRRKYALPSLHHREGWRRIWTLIRRGDCRLLAGKLWHHLIANRAGYTVVRWKQWIFAESANSLYPNRAKHHFHFFKTEEISALLADSGYQVLRDRLVTNTEHGNSLFVVAKPSNGA